MGLGDLKKQLLKAGLVDQKQVRKASQEQRQARKKKGRKVLDAEAQAKQDRLAAEAAEKKRTDREREKQRREAQSGRDRERRVVQIAESGRLERRGRPNRRWYYLARDGRVPYLAIGDTLGRRLENGSAALLESPEGQSWVVERETAARIKELDAGWIRCWNGRES